MERATNQGFLNSLPFPVYEDYEGYEESEGYGHPDGHLFGLTGGLQLNPVSTAGPINGGQANGRYMDTCTGTTHRNDRTHEQPT
jgi:hypothetical protein